MKKFIVYIVSIIICFCLAGCASSDTSKTNIDNKIVINMPNDDTVNGYRNNMDDTTENGMPDKIKEDEIGIENSSSIEDSDEVILNNSQTTSSKNTESIIKNESKPEIRDSENNSKKYCGNKNSKVFHKTDCGSVKNMKVENKVYATKQELLNDNYKACGKCNP